MFNLHKKAGQLLFNFNLRYREKRDRMGCYEKTDVKQKLM